MLVISPNGRCTDLSQQSAPARIDNTIVNALARAFRWRNLLETGACATIDELARSEKINPSYVSRILRLTLLSCPLRCTELACHPVAVAGSRLTRRHFGTFRDTSIGIQRLSRSRSTRAHRDLVRVCGAIARYRHADRRRLRHAPAPIRLAAADGV